MFPLISDFDKQWKMYTECMERIGKKIEDAREEYEKLTTTRQRQLDRVITKIETLRCNTDFHSIQETPGGTP